MESKAGHLLFLPAAFLAFLVSSLFLVCTPAGAAESPPPRMAHSISGSALDYAPTFRLLTNTDAILQESRARFGRISTAEDLSCLNVRPILQDRRGFMWIGTHGGGLNKYNGYQFTVYRHDPDDPDTLSQDIAHALYGDRGGKLWVGTESRLDRLVLSDIEGVERTAGSFTHPEKNQHAYMTEKLDRVWVYAGTRRHVDYPNLPPSDYFFRVKGSNSDGVWNEEGVTVRITITSPSWKTWGFIGLIALMLLASSIIGYRLGVRSIEAHSRELEREVEERTAALRREVDQRLQAEEALRASELEKAIAAERSRLARELHDAVTQTLFSASLIAEALPGSWERDREEGLQLLKELRQLSRGALAEMRTLLLELRPAALVEAKLGDLLHQLAEAATGREGLPITVTVEGESRLPPDVHVALYRIAQEALNNVVKHSYASHAEVHMRCLPPQPTDISPARRRDRGEVVELCIHDDGCGFNPDRVSADRLGLGIMRERADAIGARLEITSEPGRGTQVLVQWKEQA